MNPAPGFKKNPEHTITVEPFGKHVTVKSNGTVVASSDNALLLKEHVYPGVIYVPFADIDFGKLDGDRHQHAIARSRATPATGASRTAPSDAMWAYQSPFDEMTGIKDHGAFYPNRVSIETE